MSLASSENEGEQNDLRNLQLQLIDTQQIIFHLSSQLSKLKEQVAVVVGWGFEWVMGV